MGLIRYKPNMKIWKVEENNIFFENEKNCEFNHLIFATGYRPRIDSIKIEGMKENSLNKFPEITKFGESIQVENIFFGGPLAQFKPVNTFIHGFMKSILQTMEEIKRRLPGD
jgi:NADH dehydrogenase FAD-containing subunit